MTQQLSHMNSVSMRMIWLRLGPLLIKLITNGQYSGGGISTSRIRCAMEQSNILLDQIAVVEIIVGQSFISMLKYKKGKAFLHRILNTSLLSISMMMNGIVEEQI